MPDPAVTLQQICAWGGVDPALVARERQPIDLPNRDRDDLAAFFGAFGFRRGVEIGTEQGAYAEVLCRRNPGLHLTCVDAWSCYRGYREHVTQSKLDGFFEATKARLSPYHVDFIRAYSVDGAKEIPDRSLDFVYIDANHTLPFVVQDLVAWENKVKKGGIVSGHDFCRRGKGPYQVHVVEAVTAWTQSYHIAPWFVIGSKTAEPGEKRDRPRSWMYVKA